MTVSRTGGRSTRPHVNLRGHRSYLRDSLLPLFISVQVLTSSLKVQTMRLDDLQYLLSRNILHEVSNTYKP